MKPHMPSSSGDFQCPGDQTASSLEICLVSKLNHLCREGFDSSAFLVLDLAPLLFSKYDFFFLYFPFSPLNSAWAISQSNKLHWSDAGFWGGGWRGSPEAKWPLFSWGKPTSPSSTRPINGKDKVIDLHYCYVHCVLIRNQCELPGRTQKRQALNAFFGGCWMGLKSS